MSETAIYRKPDNVSDGTFRNVVSAAYTAYIANKALPTVDDTAVYCKTPKHLISSVMATVEFREAMALRGIAWEDKSGITPQQAYLISILTNPADKRQLGSRLKSAGVTYPVYRAWLKQPLFAQHLKKVSEDMLGEHMSDVHTAFLSRATSGDMRAIEFYYQMTGRFDPGQKHSIDVQAVMAAIIEIISRRVKDPETLQLIAADMQMLAAKNHIGAPVAGEVVTSEPVFFGELENGD